MSGFGTRRPVQPEHVPESSVQERLLALGRRPTDAPAAGPAPAETAPEPAPSTPPHAAVPDLAALQAGLAALDEAQLVQVLTGLDAHPLARALERKLSPGAGPQRDADARSEEERRSAPRNKVLRRGKIIFNNSMSVTNCEVRDISASGCRVTVDSIAGIPGCFTLHILNGNTRHECEVVWRKFDMMGLRFID